MIRQARGNVNKRLQIICTQRFSSLEQECQVAKTGKKKHSWAMIFFNALAGIFSLLLVVGLGFMLDRMGWFTPVSRKLFPRLITNVSLPPFLGCTIINYFQRDSLADMLYGAFIPLASLILLFAGAYGLGLLIKVKKRHFGLFCASISNPNTIFIGIPVNRALFGSDAVQYVLLYYLASTLFFWTIGNYFISRDESQTGQKQNQSTLRWQQLISPPIIGAIIGLVIILVQIPVPDFLLQAAKITGEMTTPLALIFIGLTLAEMELSKIHFGKDIIVALAGRLVASPLLMACLLPFADIPEIMGKVFIIQSSLPVLMQVAILSAYYNTDPDYGSIMVSVSTMLCALTIPIYMTLL